MTAAARARRGRDPDDERAPGERRAREPDGSASALLALQRSAGNAAVSGWLQRDRKLPQDPDSLADLSAVAKDLIIDDDAVVMSGLAFDFKSDRIPARAGVKVTTHFGGDMAATPDPAVEKRVRAGLGTVGMKIFGLDGEHPRDPKDKDDMPAMPAGAKRRSPTADLVHLKDLYLTQYGGKDGRYRFTAVARKGTAAQPTAVDLLVELLGAQRAPFKAWGALDTAERTRLQERFRRFSFVKRDARPDDTEPILRWSDDDFGKVLQALGSIPDNMLQGVQGITWVRGHQPSAQLGEAGEYYTKTGLAKSDKPERKLTVYGSAFKSDDSLIRLVAHEIGHAISNKPAETGAPAIADSPAYQAAAKADSAKAVTKYGQKDTAEHYAEAYSMFVAEPATLQALRPKTHEFFVKQRAAAKPATP